MNPPSPTPTTTMIEAFARVVSVDEAVAWLEPEPKTSCGSCTSLVCGAQGSGNTSSQLIARRFPLANDENFVVGERIVVGVHATALIKAALTAYAIPLAMMLGAGIGTQWFIGQDGITLLASIIGLLLGLGMARLGADRLFATGNMTPFFVRRASTACHSHDETCHSK